MTRRSARIAEKMGGSGHEASLTVQGVVTFETLPDVVLWQILSLLGMGAIKNLRAVSRRCKLLVEEGSNALQKLRVVIKYKSIFDQMINSGIKWCNISVDLAVPADDWVPWLRHSKAFLRRIQIQHTGDGLAVKTHNASYLSTILLNVGPSLRSFSFRFLHRVEHYKFPKLNVTKKKSPAEWKILKENLGGLRELKFECYTYKCRSGKFKSMDAFCSLLSSFLEFSPPNLHTLALPTFSWYSSADAAPLALDNRREMEKLTCVLTKYFENVGAHSTRFCSLKYIDLNPCASELQRNVEWQPFDLRLSMSFDPLQTARLFQSSAGLGVKFYNVSSEFLDSKNLTSRMSIGSVLCQNWKSGMSSCSTLALPPNCPTQVVHYVKHYLGERFSLESYKLPPSLNITSIHMSIVWQTPSTFEIPFHELFEVVRPTLKDLWLERIPSRLVNRFRLGQTFPNLKMLHLRSTPSFHNNIPGGHPISVKMQDLLRGLHFLEKLNLSGFTFHGHRDDSLVFCPDFTAALKAICLENNKWDNRALARTELPFSCPIS